jgi:hypothetical protein
VPYLNADRDSPKFQGRLAGIDVRPFDTSSSPADDPSACPPGTKALHVVTGPDADALLDHDPLGYSLKNLPKGISFIGAPLVLKCDGVTRNILQHFEIAAGTAGANPGGGTVHLFRSAVGQQVWIPAPAGRWSEGAVLGRPAAVLSPVIDTVGFVALVVNDHGVNRGMTQVTGEAVTPELLKQFVEAIER